MTNTTALGQRILKFREKSQMSQREFAQLAGVHQTIISSIERGKTKRPIAPTVAACMNAMNGLGHEEPVDKKARKASFNLSLELDAGQLIDALVELGATVTQGEGHTIIIMDRK